jgi:hypothetical protein
MGSFDASKYPAIEAGAKLDAGISYEDALELLKKYNGGQGVTYGSRMPDPKTPTEY